ncbi:MAG TPA: DUF4097 family beta strand repeat-containing protein [Lacunisphaera sp.]|jgi:hypothetical protein|nr:DUF4097 family beta strand repeat-containing protein [Lacunisphaera sp.]
MKTNLPSLLCRSLFAAGLAAAALARADDDGSSAAVKLSAPDKPATLRVDVPWADINISGVDGDTVTVKSSLDRKGHAEVRPGGLRRLDDEVTFDLSEKDNVVTLRIAGDNPWASHDADFKVTVPRRMAISVKTEAGGDLVVNNVDGDIDVNNMNGEVHLNGITGSTVVSTMNGEVHATYAKAPQKLVSITSMNGEVDLRVPADTKANVRLRSHNGSILTDFGEDVLKTKTEGHGGGGGFAFAYGANAGRLSADEARIAHEAARAAREATRAAIQVARDVSREVQREVARAKAEADREKGEADHEAADNDNDNDDTPPPAPVPAVAPAAAPGTPVAAVPAVAPRAHTPRPPIPPIVGGKLVSGTLNGGGVDIKISTMNGEITLRQAK